MRVALALAFVLFASRFAPLDPAVTPTFPRDHGSHDGARVEWWYVTGHLADDAGKRIGYQLTFFRAGLLDEPRRTSAWAARDLFLAHFARTDASAKTFRYAERAHRSGPGAARAAEERLFVTNEDWRLEELDGKLVLYARDGADELSLLLTPEKPLVLHGENGLSRKGPEPSAVSRYVSFTRLASAGSWNGRRVTGTSWMDHEWGSGSIGKEAAGWDWFSLQLADGRDVMLYRMRGNDGSTSRFSSGTVVQRDGRAAPLSASDFTLEETARWKSPRNGATYPARWTVRIPKEKLVLDVIPLVADQELETDRSTRVTYWEGACDVHGDVPGRAYVELTGYAGPGALGAFR